jgi:hypothetical protein
VSHRRRRDGRPVVRVLFFPRSWALSPPTAGLSGQMQDRWSVSKSLASHSAGDA